MTGWMTMRGIVVTCLPLWLLLSGATAQRFACVQPGECVHRPSFRIEAIVHGTSSDRTWQQIRAAMVQAGKDMRINLNLKLYDTFSSETMAADILNAAATRPDAMIVTVPSNEVQRAVGTVVNTGIPVFGLNQGNDIASTLGLLGFVAMDDPLAGSTAGDQLLAELTARNLSKSGSALYVNPEFGNLALESRYLALKEKLPDFAFEALNINQGTSPEAMASEVSAKLSNCSYSVIQLAKSAPLSAVLQAMTNNGCNDATTVIGAFETSEEVFQAIRDSRLAFTISQQPFLQGSMLVIMAALFMTTGKKLAEPGESETGVYLSGPQLITRATLPSDDLLVCRREGYPVCPNQLAANGSIATCSCTDRSQITIVGVTHGDTSSFFWDEVYAASEEAGKDFGVNLVLPRLEPQVNDTVLQQLMADQIVKYCTEGVDGLFSSIPSDVVKEALKTCVANNVTVISINSGAAASQELGLVNHIGQLEFRAGKSAGQKLISAGCKTGLCIQQEATNSGLDERCAGMAEAFNETTSDAVYLGKLFVPPGDPNYVSTVETAVGLGGSWESVCILACGQNLLPDLDKVRAGHQNMKVGTFDLSRSVFEGLDAGTLAFAIDQNAYMQGYLAVPLLAWYAYSKQNLINEFMESGPDFVEKSPSLEAQQCQSKYFKACPVGYVPPSNTTSKAFSRDVLFAAMASGAACLGSGW